MYEYRPRACRPCMTCKTAVYVHIILRLFGRYNINASDAYVIVTPAAVSVATTRYSRGPCSWGPSHARLWDTTNSRSSRWVRQLGVITRSMCCGSSPVKLAFHDADTDTDTNILARIFAKKSRVSDLMKFIDVSGESVSSRCLCRCRCRGMRAWVFSLSSTVEAASWERHRHTDLARIPRHRHRHPRRQGCYEKTAPVEFQLYTANKYDQHTLRLDICSNVPHLARAAMRSNRWWRGTNHAPWTISARLRDRLEVADRPQTFCDAQSLLASLAFGVQQCAVKREFITHSDLMITWCGGGGGGSVCVCNSELVVIVVYEQLGAYDLQRPHAHVHHLRHRFTYAMSCTFCDYQTRRVSDIVSASLTCVRTQLWWHLYTSLFAWNASTKQSLL